MTYPPLIERHAFGLPTRARPVLMRTPNWACATLDLGAVLPGSRYPPTSSSRSGAVRQVARAQRKIGYPSGPVHVRAATLVRAWGAATTQNFEECAHVSVC